MSRPRIQREIGGSLAGLQWVIDAYTLALASVMLTAGSTADRAGGILNSAWQADGALGVALLGSLLGSVHAPNLLLPLAVAVGGYLVALALTWIGIRKDR